MIIIAIIMGFTCGYVTAALMFTAKNEKQDFIDFLQKEEFRDEECK